MSKARRPRLDSIKTLGDLDETKPTNLGLRRSNALQKLILMRAEGLISAGEFARFSEATRSAVESSKGLIVLSKFARP